MMVHEENIRKDLSSIDMRIENESLSILFYIIHIFFVLCDDIYYISFDSRVNESDLTKKTKSKYIYFKQNLINQSIVSFFYFCCVFFLLEIKFSSYII